MATSRICSIPDCGKPHVARGWCPMHYRRWALYGDPLKLGRPKPGLCTAPGCDAPRVTRLHCGRHHHRYRKYGDPLAGSTSHGDPARHLFEVILPYEGDDCLEDWPFTRRPPGYGSLYYNKKRWPTHRLICTLVNGPAPARHEAAHNCGNARCVNPKHIRWATPKENQADRRIHGTALYGEKLPWSKLTAAQVREIRETIHNGGVLQKDLAKRFGVSTSVISNIKHGHTWSECAQE